MRESRIGVEGDDVPHRGGTTGARPPTARKVRVGRAAQQSIQLVELPALAFPPDPFSLADVPDPAAMEQDEPVAIRRSSVSLIEAGDAIGGGA